MNKKCLRNIRKNPNVQVLHVHCNAVTTITNLIGDLPGFDDPIWYNPDGIVNILSLNLVRKRFKVIYDSEEYDPNVFILNSPLHPYFQMSKGGLYYHDM